MVSERELVDLRAQVTRLQADSTAELLKHRERKELLEKAQQQCFKLLKKYSNCLNDLQSEREEHRVQLAARDARVAELTMAIRSFLYDGNIREGAITANGCTCKYALESVEALDAALAGKATVKESVTVEVCRCDRDDNGIWRGTCKCAKSVAESTRLGWLDAANFLETLGQFSYARALRREAGVVEIENG